MQAPLPDNSGTPMSTKQKSVILAMHRTYHTAVEFQPHRNVAVPWSDVNSHDSSPNWWYKWVRNNRVPVAVGLENLQDRGKEN